MMIQLGRWNDLTITRFTDHGAYVDGGETGEILMPRSYVKPEMRPGDVVHVFVYLDQEERLVATMEQPLAQVGEFAFLRVAWVNQFGAFLDWGLMKDLFVPFSEQKRKMGYLEPAPASYHKDREVDVLVWQRSPLGYKVIVDNRYSGLIYGDQVYDELHTGDRLRAHVVQIRPDGKLDLSLQRLGKGRFRDFSEVLLRKLQAAGGFLPFTDKTDAEAIAEHFQVSKKTFKRAVGTLYKQRRILIDDEGITLIGDE